MSRFNRWYEALPEPTRFLVAMGLILPISAIPFAEDRLWMMAMIMVYAAALVLLRVR